VALVPSRRWRWAGILVFSLRMDVSGGDVLQRVGENGGAREEKGHDAGHVCVSTFQEENAKPNGSKRKRTSPTALPIFTIKS
jgi:hypothetical protein